MTNSINHNPIDLMTSIFSNQKAIQLNNQNASSLEPVRGTSIFPPHVVRFRELTAEIQSAAAQLTSAEIKHEIENILHNKSYPTSDVRHQTISAIKATLSAVKTYFKATYVDLQRDEQLLAQFNEEAALDSLAYGEAVLKNMDSFHGEISASDAEAILETYKGTSNNTLIRYDQAEKCYVLSILMSEKFVHIKIKSSDLAEIDSLEDMKHSLENTAKVSNVYLRIKGYINKPAISLPNPASTNDSSLATSSTDALTKGKLRFAEFSEKCTVSTNNKKQLEQIATKSASLPKLSQANIKRNPYFILKQASYYMGKLTSENAEALLHNRGDALLFHNERDHLIIVYRTRFQSIVHVPVVRELAEMLSSPEIKIQNDALINLGISQLVQRPLEIRLSLHIESLKMKLRVDSEHLEEALATKNDGDGVVWYDPHTEKFKLSFLKKALNEIHHLKLNLKKVLNPENFDDFTPLFMEKMHKKGVIRILPVKHILRYKPKNAIISTQE